MLRLEDVEARIAAIREAAIGGDYEKAHGLEDDLFEEVLREIASSDPDTRLTDIAREALKSKDLDFERYAA